MAQLTQEQKNNFKKWRKSLKVRFIITMAWLFIAMPIAFLFFKNRPVWLVSEWVFIILFSETLFVRYYKKCPNCKVKIGGWKDLRNLPDKCHKCGVSFK